MELVAWNYAGLLCSTGLPFAYHIAEMSVCLQIHRHLILRHRAVHTTCPECQDASSNTAYLHTQVCYWEHYFFSRFNTFTTVNAWSYYFGLISRVPAARWFPGVSCNIVRTLSKSFVAFPIVLTTLGIIFLTSRPMLFQASHVPNIASFVGHPALFLKLYVM